MNNVISHILIYKEVWIAKAVSCTCKYIGSPGVSYLDGHLVCNLQNMHIVRLPNSLHVVPISK